MNSFMTRCNLKNDKSILFENCYAIIDDSPALLEKAERLGKVRGKLRGLVYTLYRAYKQTAGTGAFVLPCKRGKRHRGIIWRFSLFSLTFYTNFLFLNQDLEAMLMSKTIEAIYENGVLKPLEDIGIEEHKKVRITLIELTEGMREYSSDEIDEFLREDRLDKETALKVKKLLRKS